MGKTYTTKTPSRDFNFTTLENSLLSQQAVTSKGIPVPYTNLQLNPYPNTQLDLFCSDNLSFQCTAPNMWLTNSMHISQYVNCSPTSERFWLQSFSVHSHNEDHEAPWLQNPMVYKHSSFLNRKRWTKAYVSNSQYACEKLLHWGVLAMITFKTILIYV